MSPFEFLYLNLCLSGEDVPVTHCEGEPPPTEVACEVACSADCVVGSWSSWSACSHSCATKNTEGRQSRTRTVLALPGKGEATLSLAYLDFHHNFSLSVFVAVVFLCQTSKITDFNQSVTNWVFFPPFYIGWLLLRLQLKFCSLAYILPKKDKALPLQIFRCKRILLIHCGWQ